MREVVREVHFVHEAPVAFGGPVVEARRSVGLVFVYAVALVACVVATVWGVSLMGHAPTSDTRPPWDRGSTFNVGPKLSGGER